MGHASLFRLLRGRRPLRPQREGKPNTALVNHCRDNENFSIPRIALRF